MKVKIQSINVEVQATKNHSNNVHVDFEYEKENNNIEFTMNVFVGGDCLEHCRFFMNLNYFIEDIDNCDNEDELIHKCIDEIVPSLTVILESIDSVVKN